MSYGFYWNVLRQIQEIDCLQNEISPVNWAAVGKRYERFWKTSKRTAKFGAMSVKVLSEVNDQPICRFVTLC